MEIRLKIRRALLIAAVAVVVPAVSGCPTYEDTYSGTFRESGVNAVTDSRAIEVDLFRFGDNVSAVLRFYQPSVQNGEERPFARQRFCTWTQGAALDTAERTFSLPIDRGSRIPESTLQGELSTEDRLELTVFPENGEEPVVEPTTLSRVAGEGPNSQCDSIEVFLVKPVFELLGDERNEMPNSAGYDIENPVFSLQWVGVRETSGNVYVPVNAQGPTRRLGNRQFVDGEGSKADELRNGLSLSLPAPPESVRIESGETRYAIGHPVVIDDSESNGSSFTWEIDEEPVIASALQRGVPAGERGSISDVNGSGRAILFIEDGLSQLSEPMRTSFFKRPEAIADGAVPESHFYIVDILFDRGAGEIRQIRLPRSLEQHTRNRDIPMKVTSRFLDGEAPNLPRIAPR